MATESTPAPSSKTPRAEDFMVGWLCVLQAEYRAALAILDEKYDNTSFVRGHGDRNDYVLGRVGPHNVMINMPPAGWQGQVHASRIALDMRSTFPRLRFVLLVGIAGGVPYPEDIRLGDVVIGTQVFPFSTGKDTQFGRQHTGMIRTPSRELLGAIMFLMQRFWAPEELLLSESIENIRSRAGRGGAAFARPLQDRLYNNDIGHPGDQCDCKQPQSLKRAQLKHRDDREGDFVQIFQGCIGSENTVMKNAQTRDDDAREMNILCYEMEATSVMDCVPCLPIRGIADYADAHKNNQWHLYAALSAATCARELLLSLKPEFVTRFPLNVSGDIVDRYMEGAVSNPNVFSGSEIEKLRQTRDSLMERCRFLHEVSVKELENMPNSSSTKKDKARELKKFQEILGKHLEHLNQVLENHDDLLSSSDPEVREEYRRLRAQLREDKKAIDALARTAEGFLEEAANMLTTLAVYLDDRGVGIAGIVVRYVGRMLTRWRSSPMSPTVVFQWVCRKTWTVSSSQEEEFFIEMGHIEMGRQGPIKL